MSVIPQAILHTPNLASRTECLVTNGTGSFASLAVNGGLGRKFHGLLVHSVIPPMDRLLTWHSCIETLDGQSLDARQSLHGQSVHQMHGEQFLIKYQATPFPTWTYAYNGHVLKKELFMEQGKPTTLLKYTLLATPLQSVNLTLDNYVHFRAAESNESELKQENINEWQVDKALQSISAKGQTLKLGCQVGQDQTPVSTQWFEPSTENQVADLLYCIELEDQGYPHRDASLKVQQTHVTLRQGESCFMIGTLEDTWPKSQLVYQQACGNKANRYADNSFANDLAHSALHLVADRESVNGKTILAGFPWFGDWGRDTMIALPGTTLVTGQFETAKSILKTFAHYLNGGMLPNKFPDRSGEELKYNTIDATLWFYWAIQQYVEYSGDWSFVQNELYDDLKDIIQHHQKGTRFGIGMDDDGLIHGGDKDTQLTWMDVKFDGYAVTPRFGKAVEINALWYNALNFTKECAERFNDSKFNINTLIRQVKTSFQATFWNTTEGYCYDYIVNENKNDDIRCNQIIAVSLPYSPLSEIQQASVFNVVYKHLYTPVGLRSLSPDHKDYKGK
jgi:predicted glycogen debranching enzyme